MMMTSKQSILPTFVLAPPGFTSLNISSSPAAAAISSLNLLDVKTLAEQENWGCVYTNQQHSVVSFSDKRAGETISVNVFYDKAVVGIWFHHPRMGKTQSFRQQVDLADLRKIFRDPRVHTGDGYSNIKKQKKKFQKQVYSYIGDRVLVQGYEAVIIGEPKRPGDLAKIRFANGEVYRVEMSHLTLIDRPHRGCKSLYAEAEMQLERLNNELDRIMTEKMRCEKIIQNQRFGGPSSLATGIHDVNMNLNLSPKRDNVVSLKKATPSPRAVFGAFEPNKLSPSQPNKFSPSPRDVSAFEPYKNNIKSSSGSGVSIRSIEWDDAQFSIAPFSFFPANY